MFKFFFAVFGLLFFFLNSCAAYTADGHIKVTVFDIGQGDATLIETPEQNILIDTGDTDAKRLLVNKLKKSGITRLERVILTHPHADHIGGAKYLAEAITVDEFIDNGIISGSPLYKAYRNLDATFSTVKAGDVLDFGGGVKFSVLYPTTRLVADINGGMKYDLNNSSICGKLSFGDFAMILTGDAEREEELAILTDFPSNVLRADFLKAGHHGSYSSSSADFVHAVAPKFVFISAGRNNKFGHPHKRPLKTFREFFVLPANIFCTAFNGDVQIESDGFNHSVTPAVEDNWVERYTGERISVIRLD